MNKKELKEHIKSIFEKDLNPKPKPKPRPDTEDKLNDELDSTGVIDEPNQGADVEDIQQSLQSAYKKAQGLGDSKLAQQIANTITYFTRNHVLAKQELAEIHRLQELAGIENEEENLEEIEGNININVFLGNIKDNIDIILEKYSFSIEENITKNPEQWAEDFGKWFSDNGASFRLQELAGIEEETDIHENTRTVPSGPKGMRSLLGALGDRVPHKTYREFLAEGAEIPWEKRTVDINNSSLKGWRVGIGGLTHAIEEARREMRGRTGDELFDRFAEKVQKLIHGAGMNKLESQLESLKAELEELTKKRAKWGP